MNAPARIWRIGWLVLTGLSWLGLPGMGRAAEQPRFFLSTERIFSPQDESIEVKLEARGLSHLDFRLYRIAEPEAFFEAQADLHRVTTPNAKARASAVDVLDEGLRQGMQQALGSARELLSSEARKAAKAGFEAQVEGVIEAGAGQPAEAAAMPLLKDYELVDLWRESLGEDQGEWAYKSVAIDARRPGVYLVEAVSGREVGTTVVLVSNLVLLTRQSQDRFLVYAVDPVLGRPVADAQVSLKRSGRLLAKGSTDEQGLWVKDIPLSRNLVVTARRGDDFALLDPSYHPAQLPGRKLYLTTERPVYRPGQTVMYKGLLRKLVDEVYRIDAEADKTSLQVLDPKGQILHEAELSLSASGAFAGRFELDEGAGLGTYRLVADLDGRQYAGEFQVKKYRKPEYKVEVSTSAAACIAGERVAGQVQANYYFGPPVPGAKVKLTIFRSRFYLPWWLDVEHAWYYSEAEYQNSLRETLEEKEGELDAAGRFAFEFSTRPDSLDFTYGIEAVVTDASGQTVSGRARLRVTQAQFHLSLEPEYLLNRPGQVARVRVRTRDFAGQPVAGQVELAVSARKGSHPAQAPAQPLLNRRLETGAQGEAWFEFEARDAGTYEVSARAQDAAGHSLADSVRLFVTSQGGDIPFAPKHLEILADRRSYRRGDKARFLLLSPHADAHLLLTVEGGRLYRHQVIQARGYSTVVEVAIDRAQTPNFFVRAASVFSGQVLERRLDVVVPPVEQLLTVEVDADKAEARPGEEVEFRVRVKDHQGRAVGGAEVALAIVDEAIYGLGPELAVPIGRFFYHRKRNNVRSSSSLDFRFYGYGAEAKERMAALEMRARSLPGSFKALAGLQVRKDFKDTLDFAPMLITDEAGLVRHRVRLPDNLTTWRATARVITRDSRVGQATGSMRVDKPVVLRLAAPRFLVEGDRSTLALMAHNHTDQAVSLRLDLAVEAGAGELEGEARLVQVPAGGMQSSLWRVTARAAGPLRLRALAEGPTGDALEFELPVVRYGLEQVLLASARLQPGAPRASMSLTLPAQADPASAWADLSVSSGVAPAIFAALDYLNDYPYHCTEQTMSRFLPNLVVAKLMGDKAGLQERWARELPRQIQAGLSRLSRLQHDDGGWGWWFDDPSHPFMTAYVVQGLAIAKRVGQKIDPDMFTRGVKRLDELSRSDKLTPTERAYLLYSLALAGSKVPAMLEKLRVAPEGLTEYGKALVAMAMLELGLAEQARELTGELELVAYKVESGSCWGEQASLGWADDPVESTAAVLRALLATRPDSAQVEQALHYLMSARRGSRWHSTRDTAMVVFALVDYLVKFGSRGTAAELSLKIGGEERPKKVLSKDDLFKPSISIISKDPVREGKNTFELEGDVQGVLYVDAALTYFGQEDPIQARGQVFGVWRGLSKVVTRPEGQGVRLKLEELKAPVEPGELILVSLELSAERDAEFVMVSVPLPAGAEPVEQDRGYEIPGLRLQQAQVHREFHDDHVVFFVTRLGKGKRKLGFLIRASLPGSYRMLPARILPMYDPHFAGNSASALFEVGGGA